MGRIVQHDRVAAVHQWRNPDPRFGLRASWAPAPVYVDPRERSTRIVEMLFATNSILDDMVFRD